MHRTSVASAKKQRARAAELVLAPHACPRAPCVQQKSVSFTLHCCPACPRKCLLHMLLCPCAQTCCAAPPAQTSALPPAAGFGVCSPRLLACAPALEFAKHAVYLFPPQASVQHSTWAFAPTKSSRASCFLGPYQFTLLGVASAASAAHTPQPGSAPASPCRSGRPVHSRPKHGVFARDCLLRLRPADFAPQLPGCRWTLSAKTSGSSSFFILHRVEHDCNLHSQLASSQHFAQHVSRLLAPFSVGTLK